jgi:hypothetical protein
MALGLHAGQEQSDWYGMGTSLPRGSMGGKSNQRFASFPQKRVVWVRGSVGVLGQWRLPQEMEDGAPKTRDANGTDPCS